MRRTFVLAGLAVAVALFIPGTGGATSADGAFLPPPPLGLDWYMPVPDDNAITVPKIALGERLFTDRRLSSDGRVACSSCHRPDRAFADDVAISRGAGGRMGRRHTPSLINRGYGRAFFWDGRSATLEEQVLQPVTNAAEMNSTLAAMTALLTRDPEYVREFTAIFGEPPSAPHAARALATYVRVQRSGDAPFDRYEQRDRSALSPAAQRGLVLFRGRARCSACHTGPNFSDESFHNTGVAWRDGTFSDPGRFAVTQRGADRGAFKTPTLREVARTAPYMHDGSIGTLRDVLAFYNEGGRLNPALDGEIRPLGLSEGDVEDLLAFLRGLTSSGLLR